MTVSYVLTPAQVDTLSSWEECGDAFHFIFASVPTRSTVVRQWLRYVHKRQVQPNYITKASFLHVRHNALRTVRSGRLNVGGPTNDYIICLPRAIWIVPIEVGGITPTSVTTAVIFLGGVRSYNGFNISRFVAFSVASDSCGTVIGNVENTPFSGPAGMIDELRTVLSDAGQMVYRAHSS